MPRLLQLFSYVDFFINRLSEIDRKEYQHEKQYSEIDRKEY